MGRSSIAAYQTYFPIYCEVFMDCDIAKASDLWPGQVANLLAGLFRKNASLLRQYRPAVSARHPATGCYSGSFRELRLKDIQKIFVAASRMSSRKSRSSRIDNTGFRKYAIANSGLQSILWYKIDSSSEQLGERLS